MICIVDGQPILDVVAFEEEEEEDDTKKISKQLVLSMDMQLWTVPYCM